MSAVNLIKTLEALLTIYGQLLHAAIQKTEVIKKGDLSALQSIIKEENRFLQTLRKLENNLLSESKLFLQKNQHTKDDFTLSECINVAVDHEKSRLKEIKNTLEEQIGKLRKQNKLNQQLIEQSLQIVNMSIDMLSPEIDSYNYDRSHQGQNLEESNRSIFDSKA